MNKQYKDIFTQTQGVAYYLNEADSDKATSIFGNADNIASFDYMAYYEIGNRFVTGLADTPIEMGKWIWQKYYNIWIRILNILDIDYNVLSSGGITRNEEISHSETNDENQNATNTNLLQAFNSNEFVDTTQNDGSIATARNTKYDTNRAFTETKESDENKSELLQKEIDLRKSNSFFDIVLKDICNTICLAIF